MQTDLVSPTCLRPRNECEQVRADLAQANDTLFALQHGQVDAVILVTETGAQLLTLEGMDSTYRVLIETMHDGVIVVDDSGTIVYCNRSISGIFGLPAIKIMATPIEGWIAEADLPSYSVLKAQVEKGLAQGELRLKTTGEPVVVTVSIKRAHINAMDVDFYIITNITAQKLAEAKRDKLAEQLRQVHKMEAIGTLAAGIAHDINNIITSIIGNAELLRQDLSTYPQALLSLEEISKATQRARGLVQMILTFSRRQPTARVLTQLQPIIEEAIRLLRATLPVNVMINAVCDASAPAVLADAIQIQQVILNLVNNAMQSLQGKPGHINLQLDSVPLGAASLPANPVLQALQAKYPSPILRLTLSDDGCGMDAATQAHLFEPFFTTKPFGAGSGLGLSVVHGILQEHEGVITVSSALGKGSTFTIYLPAAQGEAVLMPESAAVPSALAVPSTAPQPSSGLHILCLDDDESLVLMLSRLLRRRGFQFSGYTKPSEAIAAIRANPDAFNLVVTDYNMPGMSGLEVAAAVQAIRGNLPIVMASGFIDAPLQTRASAAGIKELIYKTNAAEDFCAAIVRVAQA